MNEVIAVIGKRPIKGFSKTRLANDVGEERALELYDAFIKDFVHGYKNSKKQLLLDFHVTPAEEETTRYFDEILKEAESKITFQKEIPFFERLVEIVGSNKDSFVHLTGTDLPDFPFDIIEEATPEKDVAYIGPDADGGFYYLGLHSKHASLLNEIDPAEGVFDSLVKACKQRDLSVKILKEWSDIDTGKTLVFA